MSYQFYAHTPPDGDPTRWQPMRDHAGNVAQMAAAFAEDFGAEDIAQLAGWLHDVGKYSDQFQAYLRQCQAARLNGTMPPRAGSADHKHAGAKLVLEGNLDDSLKRLIATCIIGHHGGLPFASGMLGLDNFLGKVEEAWGEAMMETAIARGDADCVLKAKLSVLSSVKLGAFDFNVEMLTRLIFSALVDADSLDTERHWEPDKAAQRVSRSFDQIGAEWGERLARKQRELINACARSSSPVNQVRKEVYEACLAAGELRPGIFTLTVPTGGGKTRSSLAFALGHAMCNGMRRIVYAIPYTSIIDQTIGVFRDLLGADSVLEHHSAIDVRLDRDDDAEEDVQGEAAKELRRRLAAENWDAPLIVTTTVQLFESLFGNRTSECRKVHNIAKSVIVLDEVQTLPPNLLAPLISGLRSLVELCGVSVVLCTATQPGLSHNSRYLEGLPEATPIISPEKVAEHFKKLKRVKYEVKSDLWTHDRLADEMTAYPESCLAVLNTKRDAITVLEAFNDKSAFHLSTLLCGAHRKDVLENVRKALAAARRGDGPPVKLVTTQVIECGCDVDFHRVFRVRGPLDRIIQAAGRCNREGERSSDSSLVIVFDLDGGGMPPDVYKTATDVAWGMVKDRPNFDFDSPDVATRYFTTLYQSLGADVDKYHVQQDRTRGDYPSVARKVKLIQDQTVPVLVPYDQELFDRLVGEIRGRVRNGAGMSRDLWQRVQPYTVAVYHFERERLEEIKELVPDQLYQWTGRYDPVLGIGGGVEYDPADLRI